MHRSTRFLAQQLLSRSGTWCVIKSNIICSTSAHGGTTLNVHHMQIRGKKSDPASATTGKGDGGSDVGVVGGGGTATEAIAGSQSLKPIAPTTTALPVIEFGAAGTSGEPVPGANVRNNMVEEMEKLRNFTSTERNFITPLRAMQEYLLQPHDLNGLRKTLRRSPHADEPPILVYWRRDVEQR